MQLSRYAVGAATGTGNTALDQAAALVRIAIGACGADHVFVPGRARRIAAKQNVVLAQQGARGAHGPALAVLAGSILRAGGQHGTAGAVVAALVDIVFVTPACAGHAHRRRVWNATLDRVTALELATLRRASHGTAARDAGSSCTALFTRAAGSEPLLAVIGAGQELATVIATAQGTRGARRGPRR